jgi:hypothetical protein
MDVCGFAKVQAFGWNENDTVHILSTASSSEEKTMTRGHHGEARLQIPCPRAIPICNDGIQEVDHHDH